MDEPRPLCSRCKRIPPAVGRKLCERCREAARKDQAARRVRLALARPRAAPPPSTPPPELTAEEAAALARLDDLRPRTRGDCAEGPRPCPWVSCKFHLLWDRASREERQDDERLLATLATIPETCALDVADRGGLSMDEAGAAIGLVRQRVQQIESMLFHPETQRLVGSRSGATVKKAQRRLVRLRVLMGDLRDEGPEPYSRWDVIEEG